ncbi:MAG: L,D-transpeptidase family protein [Chitinophagaceae bacterium]|nr:L,D-transpeptidase family protein [Chitinophagaceae bacterium]
MKKSGFFLPVGMLWFCISSVAQTSFVDYQKSYNKVSDVFKRKEDTLRRQFEAKKLQWPAKYVYVRSFKFDSELEVWVKNDINAEYKHFKTYKVCALAGTLGPKRIQGDYQVPEGFYYINEFNPNSAYHLSLGLNYPNASDKVLADSIQPGGDIYIHGSCVTQGCIPITNPQIEELYVITSHAKNTGQEFIPVHIFPVRFNVQRSMTYLDKMIKDDADLKTFEKQMKQVFDYFEVTKQLPVIAVNPRGEYVMY